MALTAGIVGLPNVGKSTLFNAITKAKALSANYPFATIEPNVGYVDVNDVRLKNIVDIVNPRSVVYTSFSFTDIAGLVKGASKGEGLGNQFLSHIRNVDAICQVVRCFDDDDVIHVSNKIDPIDDIETVNLELIFADLEVITKRLPKIEKKALLKVDYESVLEYNALIKIKDTLEAGFPARSAKLAEAEIEVIKSYSFLTIKPTIYIMNVSLDMINKDNEYTNKVREYASSNESKAIAICAKIEEELADLDGDDKKMFLEDLGIDESGLDKLVRETYDLLGLSTFFTAGEKECRAWTFKKGMKAPECAGVIHTDFQKGFIRAEVVSYDDFMKFGGLLKAREAGKMRSEGKEYVFKDGDIVLFRFNI
ncbi:MAG: redox-regulated ATPase YchF [Bacilli bacterium]